MITVKNLRKSVGDDNHHVDILRGVNCTISTGETAAIVGVSGSGKSTLLGLMAGLDTPSSGEVWIDEVSLFDLNEDERATIRAQSVGFVFQSFQLIPSLTALENVMLPLELKHDQTAKETARRLLEAVQLGDRLHHYPTVMSGGEQQRVAIARAFAGQPKILFADEPTGNLDRQTSAQIIDLLFGLNEESGNTLVLVTHDHGLASRCNRVFAMEDGLLVETAP